MTRCGGFSNWLTPPRGTGDAILLDTVCKRYGLPPHIYLNKHPDILSIDAKIALLGIAEDKRANQEMIDELEAEQEAKEKQVRLRGR